MARYAIIENGIVQNITLWDGDTETWSPPEGQEAVLATDEATVGSTYADGIFTPPAPPPIPVPDKVSPLQMRRALRHLGLKATVDGFLATQSDEVNESWEYATEIQRSNELIAMAAMGLGMTDEQTDDLFRLANSL